ncbi:MAG: cysteine desulfurase [Frankiales bacterium]|jgi:cysteine desulfurase|nr:cysteine desulfurase [Frankiales bacterium]
MTYLDAASAAPLHPVAREAVLAALEDGWADPARLYAEGRRARMLLDRARASVAAAIGVRPDEVSFTTSGTQAVQLGMLGALGGRRRVGHHLVVSAVEHSSVLHTADWHAANGGEVSTVPVDRAGQVTVDDYAGALRADTALVCLQTANHEVGTTQPVAAVAERCRDAGVPLLVDAAQTLGRMQLDVRDLGADIVVASARKWGGPPGAGVLVLRSGTRWQSPLPSDEREAGRIPGPVNLPAVLGAAASLEARISEMDAEAKRLSAFVERIRTEVPTLVPDVEVVGHPTERLPNLVTFSCLYVDGEALLTELDRAGFSVSSGSSCTASTLTPSHVLVAMGVLSHGNVRISLHRSTTRDDIDRFLGVLPRVVADLRRITGTDSL